VSLWYNERRPLWSCLDNSSAYSNQNCDPGCSFDYLLHRDWPIVVVNFSSIRKIALSLSLRPFLSIVDVPVPMLVVPASSGWASRPRPFVRFPGSAAWILRISLSPAHLGPSLAEVSGFRQDWSARVSQ